MKKILLLFISFGLSQITKGQEVITTVDCNQTGLVVNVGSYPNSISLYHSGNYLTWPQASNVINWKITDTQDNLIAQDTIVGESLFSFGHDLLLTDTINVSAHLTNHNAIHEGFPVNCFIEDQLYWKITEVLPPQELFPDGMYTESWSFVHENVGIDQNSSVNACTLIPDPGECEAAIQKYYFNQETQQCEDFTWGGCGGVVPFDSFEECEAALCAQSEDNCCINPDWINPMAFCPLIYDPVIGCDGIEYSNSCVAQAAGISFWIDQSGSETILNWDCEPESDSTSCEAYFEWGGGNPYLVFSNLSTYSEIDPENTNLLWDFGNGYTTFSENPVYTYDSAGYYEVCLMISTYDPQNNQTCTSTYCDSISYMVPGTTWDCGPFGCYNPGTGMGQYTSLESCESICNPTSVICISTSGEYITSVGFWQNPNDPCDTGECTSDGEFLEIVIDCAEEMGIPCDGEWVEVEGQCCSECVPSDNSYCDSIILNPILPLAGVWYDSVLVVNVETYFSNYSIPYAGLMLMNDMGDTIALETMSTAGNVYGIGPNMFEERVLLLVNELVFPFTGELCVVEGFFAGDPNIACSYPVMWHNMELDQIQNEGQPKIIRIIDILGRQQNTHQSGQLLFYIYDNGFVEKLIKY